MPVEEVNPDHPVSKAMRHQWERIAALLVYKLGGDVRITIADLDAFPPCSGLIIHADEHALHLQLCSMDAAMKRASREGGTGPAGN